MLYNCVKPGLLHRTMVSWSVIIVINMLCQAAWSFLKVLKICISRCQKEQLLPGKTCEYPRSLLALYCRCPSINWVSFLQLFDSAFLLPLQFHLFVLFVTLRGQFKIARAASVALLCNTVSVLLLGGNYNFVSSRVSWTKSLLRSQCRCWTSLLCVISVLFIDLL